MESVFISSLACGEMAAIRAAAKAAVESLQMRPVMMNDVIAHAVDVGDRPATGSWKRALANCWRH